MPVTQYVIMRDSVSTGWKAIDSVSFGNNSWTDINTYMPNDTIGYYIRIDHPTGCSPSIKNPSPMAANLNSSKSNAYRVDSSMVTQIQNWNSDLTVNIFPNPNTGSFSVAMDDPNIKDFAIKLFNSLGELVYVQNVKSAKADLNLLLAQGVYHLQIISRNGIANKKIVIQ